MVLVGSVALVVVAGVLALVATLPRVRADLDDSRSSVVTAEDDLARGDIDGAREHVRGAARSAGHADGRTHDLLWRLMGHVPVVRNPVHELQAMSSALHTTTGAVLPPLLDMTDQPAWTGRVDVARFGRLQGPLQAAALRLEAARHQLREAPHSGVTTLGTGRQQLDNALTRLAGTLGEAKVVAVVVPQLMTGDKRFLLAVQNNAEPRATGGLLGAYGLLRVRDGAFSLLRVGPNNDLNDSARPAVELGQEYQDRYGRFEATSSWRSANLTPDAPTTARIWTSLWLQQFHERLDGVLLVDPVALADLLRATGAVTLQDRTRLTAENAVRVLLIDAYRRFPTTRDAERNDYLAEAARRVVQRLARPGLRTSGVLQQVGRAAASGHLQVVASSPDVEASLSQARFGGALQADGPYLSVVTQDVGGSKLGSYLERAVEYTASPTGEATDLGRAPELEEEGDVAVTLTNTAPGGLPSYVTARADDPLAPRGQAKYWVSVYLGADATLLGATLDGRSLAMTTGSEKGLAVFSTFLTLDRGAARVLRLHVRQPARPGQPLIYRQQPLLRDDALEVRRQGAPLELLYAS